MSSKNQKTLKPLSVSALCILLFGALIYYLSSPANEAEANIAQEYKEAAVVDLGRLNWRQRDADGYLSAPPHDETGHTWHHPDSHPFLITKYGIEEKIGNHTPTTCLLTKTRSLMQKS